MVSMFGNLREDWKAAKETADRRVHIIHQGFPTDFNYMGEEYWPGVKTSGEFSAEARAEYAEEKARRDPLNVDPFG